MISQKARVGIRVSARFEILFKDAQILDVGCGDGVLWISNYFSKIGKYVVGLDIQSNRNWAKLRLRNGYFITADAHYLPFRGQAFDTVFEKDSFHHMGDLGKALEETPRTSSKFVVIVEANRYNPISYLHMVILRSHNHLSQKEFKQLISSRITSNRILFTEKEAHFYPFKINVQV